MGRGGGGGGLPISSDGVDWRIFGGLKFSIPGFFWLVFHLRGDFLHFQNNLKLLMKQKKFSGVSFFLGGGGWFLSPFDHSVTWNLEETPPPPVPENWVPKKELLRFQ